MKNDFEILREYIEKNGDKNFFESLSYPEQVLFMCCYRDTIVFNIYLLRYRIKEFYCNIFANFIKNFKKQGYENKVLKGEKK